MSMDKVASSPALQTMDGWTGEDNSLSENETAALSVALGVGMSMSANEDPQERHTVADLASLMPEYEEPIAMSLEAAGSSRPESPRIPLALPLDDPPSPTPEHPRQVDQTSLHSNLSHSSLENSARDTESKVASFYIGDEHGCTGDLPPPGGTTDDHHPTNGQPRRVQISDNQTKTKPVVEFTPPDGGHGWVVAFAACLVNMWIVGFIKSYGVLYVHVRNAFPDASAYHASWLPALLATIGLLIAPMTGTLCRKFTSRKVSFTGGVFCFLGLLLGSQAVSMNQLICSVGVLTGLGAGLTTTPGVLVVSLYFEKRRALASAICVSGNALGGFFMPPLVDYLLFTYGLRGTMLILAGLQLHICAASMLYRPIHQHALIQAHEKSKQQKQPDLSESVAPVPEHNKLLPNTPATPRAALPSPASAPGTPMPRSHAIWHKMVRRRINSTSTTMEDEELQRQVSFLRSASMMNSIPDLTQYARSWSISGERASLGSRSSIRMTSGSKSSLSRLSAGTSSKGSLSRLGLVCESRHPPLLRLKSEGDQKVAKHPTLVRLASEEEGTTGLTKTLSGGGRHPHTEVRTQVRRQSSCRRVQGRIMTAVKEADTDSQTSDELECQSPKTDTQKGENEPMENNKPTTDTNEAEAVEKEKNEKNEEEDNDDEDDLSDTDRPSCCYACMMSCVDISLFKNPLFLMMAASVFFMASGAPHAIFFLPAYAYSIDIPSSSIPHMLSISSLVDLVGRLGVGFVSDLGIFKISDIYFLSGAAAGVAVLLVPQMKTFISLSAVLGVYGFGVGAWFVLIPTLLARHHGASRLASSYGLVRLFHGLMNFISPQVNGLLVDSTGTFVYCYYFMGSCMVISSVLLLLEPFLGNYVSKKEEKLKQQQANATNRV